MIVTSYPISYYIKTHYQTDHKQSWILNKTDEKYDYAVLGSSRVLNMVDIRSLDSAYGKKGINLGTSGTCYAENYILFSEFISKNQVSTLILNVDEYSFNSEKSFSYPFHEYEFLNLSDKYDEVFKDYIPGWKYYAWKVLPILKYSEYNHQYRLDYFPQEALNTTLGSELLADSSAHDNNIENKTSQSEMSQTDQKYFLKIIGLCDTKNINIILITTPLYTPANQARSVKPFLSYVNSISRSKNIPYYSFENLINSTDLRYFNDNTHTGSKGSIEYSKNLGTRLKSDKIK